MRKGWEIKTLEEVCKELFAGGDVPKNRNSKFITEEYNVPIFSNGAKNDGLYGFTDIPKVKEPSVTVSARGTIGYSSIRTKPFLPVVRLIVLIPNKELISLYFLKYVIESMDFGNSGTSIPQLTVPMIKKYQCLIPPLTEQKQIVAILDQAFKAIDQAKANIEKNIANAKELFQSKLNDIFSQKGDAWVERKFSDLFKLKSGDGLTAKNMKEGTYPVYGGNGIAGYHNDYNKDGKYLIIGRVGALCGNVRLINDKFWLTDNAFQISEMQVDFNYEFLSYLLNSKELRSYARQAAQPVISNSSLKDVPISYPKDVSIQKEYSNTFIQLETEIKNIVLAYENKIDSLEELKKSILQKAFAGELSEPVNKTIKF